MVEIGYLILGIVAGILSGLFGIGGGIVMVPSLIVIFGMDILDANATSLAAMLLPVGILGVWAYYKAGLINIKESLWISLGLFLGSFAGGELAVNISESLLAKLYAAILLYIAVSYFDIPRYFQKKKEPKPAVYPKDEKTFWAFILVGVGAGVFAGLFGKGGGIIIVPMLIGIFHYDAKVCCGYFAGGFTITCRFAERIDLCPRWPSQYFVCRIDCGWHSCRRFLRFETRCEITLGYIQKSVCSVFTGSGGVHGL